MKGETMDNPQATVVVPCVWCDSVHNITMPVTKLIEWQVTGEVMSTFGGSITAGQRELLISGTCDDCWQEFFGKPEDSYDFDQEFA
jgi:hypothetical protein